MTVVGGIKLQIYSVGSNVGIFGSGFQCHDVKGNVYQEGYLNLVGNIAVTGNITVTETATYIAHTGFACCQCSHSLRFWK